MIDIMEVQNNDLFVFNSDVKKAENVLSTQLGYLVYAPDFGCDLEYFLQESFTFQNEAFKSYLMQRLAESSIDVQTVIDVTSTFTKQFNFKLAEVKSDGNLMR